MADDVATTARDGWGEGARDGSPRRAKRVPRSSDGVRNRTIADRQSDRAAERGEILEAATNLFFDNGYDRTTMDEIATAAGLAKPRVYLHFVSKSEIFSSLCLRSADASVTTIASPEDFADPIDRLFESCRRIALVSLLGYKTNALFFREPQALDQAARDRMRRLGRRYAEALAGVLADCRAGGALAHDDPRLASRAIGGIVASLHRWYDPRGALSPGQLACELATLMVQAVGAARPVRFAAPETRSGDGSPLSAEAWAGAYGWLTRPAVRTGTASNSAEPPMA